MKPTLIFYGQISTKLVWSTLDSGIGVHMRDFL